MSARSDEQQAPQPAPAEPPRSTPSSLAERMARPQRHRLLQGYPALPQMKRAVPPSTETEWTHRPTTRRHLDGRVVDNGPAAARTRAAAGRLRHDWDDDWARVEAEAARASVAEDAVIDVDRSRRLIVGVLPHTQCTPRVEGCGFCTFPHDKADSDARGQVAYAVVEEIRAVLRDAPDALQGRAVDAIYFGGGTANLTSTSELGELMAALGDAFNVSGAEVSLEGVPVLFTSFLHAPLTWLAKLPVRRRRISMGIQTFERRYIEMMGRDSFGDRSLIEKLVKKCRSMDIGTSGDLLFNLPGQTLAQMEADVDVALACGLEQICLYNLVLYAGLGTPWSRDPALVAAMPDNDVACDRWLALRERLLAAGYLQTTVTNFERSDVAGDHRAFVYERAGFSPEDVDSVGFGPLSLSTLIDPQRRSAVKLMRRKNLETPPWSGDDLFFACGPTELAILAVTRGLAKLAVDRAAYRGLLGSDVTADFPASIATLQKAGLITIDDTTLALTPRGMFYSDSVVGTLAAERDVDHAGAAGIHTRAALAGPVVVRDYLGMG